MTVRILQGDCRDVLKTLPDESVHCVVTSPPYFGLRDYGHPGQIGLEPAPEEYVARLVEVFAHVRRVLRADGTVWLNLGDSYGTGTTAARQHGKRGLGAGTGDAQDAVPRVGGMAKQLFGIPWRVAFALQADGWWLRQDIIWAKPNPMPESVTDRCTKSHEYLFLLAKSERYHYDANAIAEEAAVPGGRACGPKNDVRGDGETHNKRSVWTVSTKPFSEAHFATFPPALIEPCILAGCPALTCGACGTALDSRYGNIRAGTKGKELAPMRMVRGEGVSGPQESSAELLQQGLCVPLDREESQHNEGALHDIEGLHRDLPAESPGCVEGRVRDGTPAGHGEGDRPAFAPHGSRSPSRWQSRKQQTAQSGNAHEAVARPPTETQDRDDSLPPLRREDTDFSVCPSCAATLDQVGVVPGVVLDCFGGAGTTGLVADRHGRNAILIELNPEYAEMARKRIHNDAPLFADVA